jgi:hypothetical protein
MVPSAKSVLYPGEELTGEKEKFWWFFDVVVAFSLFCFVVNIALAYFHRVELHYVRFFFCFFILMVLNCWIMLGCSTESRTCATNEGEKKCQFGPVRLYYNSCYSRISSESHSEKHTVWYNVTNDLYTYIYIRLLFVESDQQNRSESFFVRCI